MGKLGEIVRPNRVYDREFGGFVQFMPTGDSAKRGLESRLETAAHAALTIRRLALSSAKHVAEQDGQSLADELAEDLSV